jgi:hypothetical protein
VIFLSCGMVFRSVKKHLSVPGMFQIPWKRCPHSLPKPLVQSGCKRGSFMRAEYSISFPVTGWMTALAWCRFEQCLFPRVMAMWAESIPQKVS